MLFLLLCTQIFFVQDEFSIELRFQLCDTEILNVSAKLHASENTFYHSCLLLN